MQFYQKEYVSKMAPRKRGASKRKSTVTYKRLLALSKQMGSAVQLDLVHGIKTFKARVSPEKLAESWAKGDYGQVMAHIPWDKLPEDLGRATKGIRDTASLAAHYQIEHLPPNVNAKLRFDVSSPKVRNFIEQRTGSLIVGIQSDTQIMIQGEVAKAFTTAQTPRQIADQIKSGIGLQPRHEIALEKYRAGLEENGLSASKVEELAGAYEDRLLDYRAMAIARTETRAMVNHTQLAVWKEGIAQGLISAKSQKEWFTADAPCPVCEPMDGVRVGIEEPFMVEFSNGQIQAIDSPPAHPQCFCGSNLIFSDEQEESE